MAKAMRWSGVVVLLAAAAGLWSCDPACEATLNPLVCMCYDGRTPSDSCPSATETCTDLCANYGGGTVLVDAGPVPHQGD